MQTLFPSMLFAIAASLYTFFLTGSLFIAFILYSSTGMTLLMAVLLFELVNEGVDNTDVESEGKRFKNDDCNI